MGGFVVGLTGGIGSGKSTIAKLFMDKGIGVVNADQCARDVVEPGTTALAKISSHFGADILLTNGTLNRSKLRQIIFQDAIAKKWLEDLLHPLIGKEIIQQLSNLSSPYTILESPLLLETSQKALCQRVLVVDVDEETQIVRTMQRDQNSRDQVKAIMNTQMSRSERKQMADDLIDNTRDLHSIQSQVEALHTFYLKLAKSV